MKRRIGFLFLLLVLAVPLLYFLLQNPRASRVGGPETGAALYDSYCKNCHGETGKGDGPLAYLVYPKPRNFTRGLFKLRSTPSGQIPTDADLARTIRSGMPGTAMPSFYFLADSQVQQLVSRVKSLSQECPEGKPCNNHFEGKTPEAMNVPEPLPYSQELVRKGSEIYVKLGCFQCHGTLGKGDGPSAYGLKDGWGFPIPVRDFTSGDYVGGSTPSDLYLRFMAGMDGTPMPSFESTIQFLGQDERERQETIWGLIYYVKSLETKKGSVSPAPPKDGVLTAMRLDGTIAASELANLRSAVWDRVPAAPVPLSRLWQQGTHNTGQLDVRAAYTSDSIAVMLEWEDNTNDNESYRIQQFQDAAAVQFSLTPIAGFLGMGQKTDPTNIWFWRSEWQMRKDEGTKSDLNKAYGNRASDADVATYPAEISEELRLAGMEAANLISQPQIDSPVEDLNAQGAGTLTSQPKEQQNVAGRGESDGKNWRVVFVRSLKDREDGDVQFQVGKMVPLAFAVWNGSERDRNGQKMISTWYSLKLAEGGEQ